MPSKRTAIAVVLSMIVLASAGCAGWGGAGLSDPEHGADGDDVTEADVGPDEGGTSNPIDERDAPSTNVLTVNVTDGDTGAPVEGATVYVVGADGDPDETADLVYEAETDRNGLARIEVRKAMNYVIGVEANGYADAHYEISLEREAEIELEPAD